MREDRVQRPGNAGEIERVDEHRRVLDLAAATAAHESPELRVSGTSVLRRLLLQGAERPHLTLLADDLLDRGRPEGPDQLVLEVGVAHVEPKCFHLHLREVAAQPGATQSSAEVIHLAGVVETGSTADTGGNVPDRSVRLAPIGDSDGVSPRGAMKRV